MRKRFIPSLPHTEFVALGDHREGRPATVVSTAGALEAVGEKLAFSPVSRIEITEATEEHWRALLEGVQGEVLYAVGGGLAVDGAKFLAAEKNLPLVAVPTALSCDAFLTATSAARSSGCVRYVETKSADRLLIDLKLLGSAPEHLRAAGIVDLLSIATARWDWKYAEDQEQNPFGDEFFTYADQVARAILRGALDCAFDAGAGKPLGLKQLLDCMALEVQLCNQLGHSRAEEGSEHYFAYAAENHVARPLPHGELVAPGILVMAAIQKVDPTPLRRALEASRVRLDSIPIETVEKVLHELPEYCRRHKLAHGVAHDLTEEMIAEALAAGAGAS